MCGVLGLFIFVLDGFYFLNDIEYRFYLLLNWLIDIEESKRLERAVNEGLVYFA